MDIKVVLSLLAILSAAAVALFCDYRRNSEARMREAMVELKVREAETEALVAKTPEGTARKLSESSRQNTARAQQKSASPPEVPAETGTSPESVPMRRTRRREPDPKLLIPESPELQEGKETDMASNKSLSEWLIQRAVARAAEKAAAENQTMEPPLASEAETTSRLPAEAPPADATLADASPQVMEEATGPGHSSGAGDPRVGGSTRPASPSIPELPPEPEKPASFVRPDSNVTVVVDEFLWESLLSTPSKPEPKPQPKAKSAVLEMITGACDVAIEISIPPGFHDSVTLSKRLADSRKFSGLVVVIGVGQADSRLPQDLEILAAVREVLEGLLGKRDFCCRTGEDEFLMICPGESGMEAQRRLNFLSESLWDYQLQTLGTFSILFSLGSVDVQDESLQDAIISAQERMAETRRSRKLIPIPPISSRPKLV